MNVGKDRCHSSLAAVQPVQIVISMSGGLVQDAYCSHPDANLTIVDWDTVDCDLDLSGLVEIEGPNGRRRTAYVAWPAVLPLVDLAGSDIEAAIEQAELAGYESLNPGEPK